MADKEGFEVDQLGVIEGTSFSQLLYDVEHEVLSLQMNDHHHQSDQTQVFNYSNADLKSPKMLCFGDFENKEHINNTLPSGLPEVAIFRPVVTCGDSSSSVSSKPNNKKRNEPVQEKVLNTKKPKIDKPSAGKKREKLGERIVALQQLVSPFGKTDTASVLHEALGYIRFLQDQVQVLCSPYLQCLPSLSEGAEKKGCDDLRSRGLCLVPVDYTKHVANNNGADYWSSSSTTMATSNHNVSSATGY